MNGLEPECDMRNWKDKGEYEAPINTPIGLFKELQKAEKALEEHHPKPPAPAHSSSYGMGM